MDKIILANENENINIDGLIIVLNSICSHLTFEKYNGIISIPDTVIYEDTFNKIKLDIEDNVKYFFIFTNKRYNNNYFYEENSKIIIVSYYLWEKLTSLPKSNGVAFFIANQLAIEIDKSFRHDINDKSKPECIYDFLIDKTGIDTSIRASLICPKCNNRIKEKIKNSEKKMHAYNNLKALLNEIGNASKWDDEIISFWDKKNSEEKNLHNEKKSIFISYSHVDSPWLQRVKIHLKPIERNSLIEIWEDTRIKTGDNWKEEIEKALQRSHAAILLISADFLASDFIIENELPQIMKLAEEHGTRIFQILISPCCFEETPQLSQFQTVNPPSKTLIEMNHPDQERLLLQLAKGIIAQITN